VLAECVRLIDPPFRAVLEYYDMKAGGNTEQSRSFAGIRFNEAQFFAETLHPNNQMPGDSSSANAHVHFTDCKTRVWGSSYGIANLTAVSGGADYGMIGPTNGNFEIWDTRCHN
jgi:hypothetical protein